MDSQLPLSKDHGMDSCIPDRETAGREQRGPRDPLDPRPRSRRPAGTPDAATAHVTQTR
ncbi:hypothetical protein SAMN05216252_14733 [Actinacidiphila glaucinigra]|uniref:Uncharacterized protein n=1 Tax=Actinacidiphila glaucinigra TaxID=235986 RepID=A0A239NUH6_9ACTN|nr:hypothetical protein SAMN05216252_14733 [Actinacidiphila glaucinigra]